MFSRYLFSLQFLFLLCLTGALECEKQDNQVVLFSHDIDPCVTEEMVKSMGDGSKFPTVKGLGTAYYAKAKSPNMPLKTAVDLYLSSRNPKNVKDVRTTYPIFGFFAEYEGIKIVDWDNDKSGLIICRLIELEADFFDRERHGLINVDARFQVTNHEEAEKVLKKIVHAVTALYPKEKPNKFHFSKSLVFVTKRVPVYSAF